MWCQVRQRWAQTVEEVEVEVGERHLTQMVAEGSWVPEFRVAEVVLRWFAVAKDECVECKGLRRRAPKTQ